MPGRPPSRVAVIGAQGFIGARLVSRLAAQGRPPASFTPSRPAVRDGVLDAAVRAARVIFYLAASVTSATAQGAPERTAGDVAAFTGLLDALAAAGGRPTVVFTSSAMVYDAAAEPPYDESAPTRADTAYAAAKLTMERALTDRSPAVHPVLVRLATVYGPGPPRGVVAHWLTCLAMGQPLPVLGDLGIRRDYVYVDDVVDALARIASAPPGRLPRVLNIGSGSPVSLRTLLREIGEVNGCPPPVRRQPGRAADRPALWLDIRAAAAALDWCPQTSLATGLNNTWRSLGSRTNPQSPIAP